MQLFESFAQTLSLKDSYSKIVNALKTLLSMSSGTTFPTTELQVGMLCYRTDQKKLYLLTQDTPSASWLALFDLSSGSAIALAAASVAWSVVTGKPNTLAGYGITDAAGRFGGSTTGGVANWNDVSNTKPGYCPWLLHGTTDANGPGVASYFHVVNMEYSSVDGTGNVTQVAFQYGPATDGIFIRSRYNGTWTAWRRTLTNLDQTGTWGISVSGNAATATAVGNTLAIKFDAGTTEGTNLYTFNGSAAKTLDIKAGSNITLTKAAGVITISATTSGVTSVNGNAGAVTAAQIAAAATTGYGYTPANPANTATKDVGHNVVGSFCLVVLNGPSTAAPGSTVAGSSLQAMGFARGADEYGVYMTQTGSALSGTWRILGCHGNVSALADGTLNLTRPATLAQRIS